MTAGRFQKTGEMSRSLIVKISLGALAATVFALSFGCASHSTQAAAKTPAPAVAPVFVLPPLPPAERLPRVMLGIDVLEADGFKAIAGKKIGLLTHPAGVNRRGEPTLNVLLRSRQSKLVALFAPEHGLEGNEKAGDNFADTVDKRTGLPVYSLHGVHRKPTKAMLKGLDAVVIDLQDIGVRSYTFSSAMVYTMAACFESNVEVIVLDRPNPLGGLKVDGPPLDLEWKSYVGALRVPYVHGLTMGELARLAKDSPNSLIIPKGINVSDALREKGRLIVVPMRGWTRAMRWPDTELKWVATSPYVQDFAAVVGYAMVGLGTELGGFTWGIGSNYPFRGIGFPKKTPDDIIREFEAYRIPGIKLIKAQGLARDGKIISGVYVDVVDYNAWRPTELSFYMMKTAAKWNALNPFILAPSDRANMYNKLVGSNAWWAELRRAGAKVNVDAFIQNWAARAKIYQEASRKYWLYQ